MRIQILLSVSLIFFYLVNLSATSITVSTDIGFDVDDNTTFLEFALNDTVEDTIIIDKVDMDWNTGPITVGRDDITIIIEDGVILRALPGEFDIFESLLRFTERSNIDIIGYGASIIMNKDEYIALADSEFRHGILLQSVTNVTIEGLTILDTGGDGMLLTRSFLPNSPKNYCENVLVKNCKFSNNYRQGMSITSAKDLTVLNCEFSDTNGTLPEDGIDFEPDDQAERLENILVKDCRIFNNYGNALQFALLNLDDNSIDVSITIENTYMANNHDPSNTFAYAEIAATDNGEDGVDGFVDFTNCFIESSEWTAVYVSKTVDSYDLNFTNCVFKDVSNDPIAFNNPIFFEVTDYENPVPRFGGSTFVDCVIIYDPDIPFFDLVENLSTSDGLGDVTGNFFVFNPNDAGFETGTNPENVDITYEYFESVSASQISLTATQLDYLEDDGVIAYEISVTNSEDYPIAATFDYDGDAGYGFDYDRGRGFIIFPPNTVSLTDSLEILTDTQEEETEILTITGINDNCIQYSQDSTLQLSISDMVTSSITTEIDEITIYPNPFIDQLVVGGDLSTYDVYILDVNGVIIDNFSNESGPVIINLSSLGSGIYFLRLQSQVHNQVHVEKIIKGL